MPVVENCNNKNVSKNLLVTAECYTFAAKFKQRESKTRDNMINCKLQTSKGQQNERRTHEGLYQPSYEHDACGVGMVVNIHGGKSHELVDNALRVLENMEHRGAETRDKTGDGAGIMVQIPHEFILLQGIPVPEKGRYGTGLVFMPKDEQAQEAILSVMIEEIEREGLQLMHVRFLRLRKS